MTPEVRAMKEQTLDKAVRIMHNKVNDRGYIAKLKPRELTDFLALIFDRCGLPKVTQAELTGENGEPMITRFTLSLGDTN